MEKERALPKNVRQIGDIPGNKRIYMEDYVVTYIHKKEKQEEKEGFLGVFLGERQKEDGETRLFIRGLMSIALDRWEIKDDKNKASEHQEETEDQSTPQSNTDGQAVTNQKMMKNAENQKTDDSHKFLKREEAGTQPERKQEIEHKEDFEEQKKEKLRKRSIREECKDYFDDWEIVGCCVIGTYPVEPMKHLMEEVPASRGFLYHLEDQEEHLYWTDTGKYEEISGYFVFYEQNRNMQEYMAEAFHERGEEKEKITDQAIKVFREKIKKKDQANTASMMKLASSFFVVTVLIIGAVVVTRIGTIRDRAGNSGAVNGSETGGTIIQSTSPGGIEAEGGVDAASVNGTTVSGEEVAVSGTAVLGETVLGNEVAADGSTVSRTTMSGEEAAVSGTAVSGETIPGNEEASDGSIVSGTAVSGEEATVGGTAVSGETVPGNEAASDESSVSGTTVSGEEVTVGGTAVLGETVPGNEAVSDGSAVSGTTVSGEEAAAGGTTVSGETAGSGGASSENTANQTEADVEASAQVRQIQASYVIREGDTLADICQKYYGNLNKLEEICQENGIQDANKIMPGQKITLP